MIIDKYPIGDSETTDFVFQSIEIKAGLSSHRRIDLSQKCPRYMHTMYSPFEARSSKPTEIGNHSSSHIHQNSISPGPLIGQYLPNLSHTL